MFGYVNVNRNDLSEENRKAYQSYYCGLCQELSKNYGKKGQLLLNYDITFLAILLTGLYEPAEEAYSYRCALHPTKKLTPMKSEIIDYASDMNILLAYHNLMDDWYDNRKTGKMRLARMIEKDYHSAALRFPRQANAIELYMQKIREAEKENNTNIDYVSGLTGNMLGELLAMREDEWYDRLKGLGLYLGKFIYLMDAYEDAEKDDKKGNYNPLLPLKKESPVEYELTIKLMLTSQMTECAKMFEQLPILLHADILRNIIYSGVWTRYEYLAVRRAKKDDKKGK